MIRSFKATIAVALLLLPAIVFADDGVTVPAGISTTGMLVMLGCAAVTYCARRLLPGVRLFQGAAGALALALISAAASGMVDAIQAHGFDSQLVVRAALAAMLSLFAGSNPTMQAQDSQAKRAAKRAAKATALVLLPAVLLSSCACFDAKSPKYNTKGCVIARQVVDCTKGSIFDLAKAVGPAIAMALITGAKIDLQALAAAAEKNGVGNGLCILAAIEADLNRPGLPPAAMTCRQGVHAELAEHARKLYGPGLIDIKVPAAGGQALALVSVQ